MKLYYSSTSPFVRKVNIFAIEAGLDDQLEWVTTNPWQAEDHLTTENPLSKIPTLITDDGEVIYDSGVICEYLDSLHNGEKLIPGGDKARWQILRLQALADGILDAGILRFMERKRASEMQSKDWDDMQKGAVERGLDYLERSFSDWANHGLNLAVISVACVLGWLDFRFSDENWRANRPNLNQWFDEISSQDSMLKTLPKE